MKKTRLMSMLCAIAMALTLVLPVSAAYVDPPESNQLNTAAAMEILSTYVEEIALVEHAAQCTISRIDDTTLPILADVSVAYLDDTQYRFGKMMDDIAVAYTVQKMSDNIASLPRANNEVIKNLTVTVYQGYSALKGKYQTRAAVDSSSTLLGEISISISGTYKGIVLAGGVSKKVAYTVNGPAAGSKLYNGDLATHNYGCGVLYGTIMKTEWDLYNTWTNQYVSHHVTYAIDQNTADLTPYTMKVCIPSTGELYIDSALPAKRTTARWSNQSAFASAIVDDPLKLLNGQGNK